MSLQSTFTSDLKKERKLALLLDIYYARHLEQYTSERVANLDQQIEGIDIVFTHLTSGKKFFIDEKAQLDYINEELPTFAFELQYQKRGQSKKGWLFDSTKKTDFYALVTSIYTDEPNVFTSCKITFVNRKKFIHFLNTRGLSEKILGDIIDLNRNNMGKLEIDQLDSNSEGYLYFSKLNKAEKPINLVLKLDFLTYIGVAKRFV